MPRKPARSQIDTCNDIRDTAFRLFGRSGYDGVSIDAIAKGAGLSKGALYWHFAGKEALYLDCLQRLHSLYDECIFGPMQASENAMQRLILLFRGLANLIEDQRLSDGIAGYWLGGNTDARPEIERVRREFEHRTAGVVRDTLKLGIEQGSLDLGADIDDMSRAIVAVMETIVLPLSNQSYEEVHRLLAVLARTLVRAYALDEELVNLFQEI